MVKTIIGIVLLFVAGAGVYLFGVPLLGEVQAATTKVDTLEALIVKRETLNAIGSDVIRRYETISAADIRRIEALIPDQIDNVKLILELQQLGEQYGLVVERIDVSGSGARELAGRKLNTVSFQADLRGEYANFVDYLEQIERNQRLIDLRSAQFEANPDEEGQYGYNITLDTYWLE